IPTAVGGCVFIAREALTAAGGFDAKFADAGALVDFCVRAARAGYRHLLAADLFVLRETAAAAIPHAIDEHYPGFAHAVELFLATIGIDRVHFHHVHDLPREALALGAELGAPYDVTLHDYFPICPRYHLAPGEGGRCTVDELRGCDRCLAHAPAQWGLALGEWRSLFRGFLRGAERVIAPSHDVVARLQRHFPDVTFLEWPHPEMPHAMPAIHKVAILGCISVAKGARLLEACVADAAARRLPLHFRVLGQVDRPMATWPAAPLSIAGTYS